MRPARAPLRKAALLANMEVGRWYTQQTLADIGGSRFPARLHEVAREHPTLTYQCRELDSDTGRFEYRLVERGDSPRPVRRVSRLKQLEAEVERLNSELSKLRRVLVPVSENLDLLLECRVAEVGP